MTIDAHHHVWDLSVRDQDWIPEGSPIRRDFTVADLAPEAAAAGVDRTVLVQTVTVAEDPVQSKRHAIGRATCGLDPRRPGGRSCNRSRRHNTPKRRSRRRLTTDH